MPRFHEQTMGVYFDDLDPYRILHNARYFLLFERTLGSFWEKLGFDPKKKYPDLLHLVRANAIDYLRPVRGIGQVRVRVWIERLGTTSLTFGFRMMPLDRDVDYARGSRTVVRVSAETWQPSPWTAEFRDRLEPWLEDSSGT